MRRPVALDQLVNASPDPNHDAAIVLAVARGARAAHMVAEDTGIPLPTVWESLRRLIEWEYITAPHPIFGMAPTRKGETVARASYSVREHTFVPPVPPDAAPADHLGGAA